MRQPQLSRVGVCASSAQEGNLPRQAPPEPLSAGTQGSAPPHALAADFYRAGFETPALPQEKGPFHDAGRETQSVTRLRLVVPGPEHRAMAEAMKEEFFAAGERVIHGSALLDQMAYDDWLESVRRNADARTVRPDWVEADTYFVLRERDGVCVGMVDLRHSLGQPFLKEFGGHIGYAVRPSLRRRGYGVQMLRLALARARALGLSEVMLSCFAQNTASARTIEACGGSCVETKPYTDGTPVRVYRIALSGA